MGLRILAAVTVLWRRAILYICTDVTEEFPTSCIMLGWGGISGGSLFFKNIDIRRHM